MVFSVITKNLNWNILTKNLVTFKRWDGVKDEKFKCYGDSLKNLIFRGGLVKKQYIVRNCLKRGLGQFADLRWGRGLAKKGSGVFKGGVDTPVHTMMSIWEAIFCFSDIALHKIPQMICLLWLFFFEIFKRYILFYVEKIPPTLSCPIKSIRCWKILN